MNQALDFHQLKAMLDWHVELGATEAIGDVAVNRYDVPAKAPKPASAPPAEPEAQSEQPTIDAAAIAEKAARAAQDIEALKAALTDFEHCDLKRGSRGLVFAKGHAGADVMVIGEAPDRDDERAAKPFSGPTGVLLDKMFSAIGRSIDGESPDSQIYVTNCLPWCPPQNRDPKPDEISMMAPFLRRHIALAKPKAVVVMGNMPLSALFNMRGISRNRGIWKDIEGTPALLMQHPMDLMRNPAAKRDAWKDLLALKAKVSV